MESQGRPNIDVGLLPVGSIEWGIGSVSARKSMIDCGSLCERRPHNNRDPYPLWIYLLGLTFTSLATTYLVLRCFNFERERRQVVGSTRSLAGGSDRPCDGDTNPDEEEVQALQAGGFKVTSGEGDATRGFKGYEEQARAARQRLPSTTASGTFGQPSQHRSPRRPGISTPAVGISKEPLQHRNSSVGVESALQYDVGKGMSGDVGGGSTEPCVGGAVGGLEARGDFGAEPEGQLHGNLLELWKQRRLPPHVEQQVVNLLQRMANDASLCRSLLPTLNASEGLRLTYEVLRLLALDLGAISLVQEHLEPFRLMVGDALMALGLEALEYGGYEGKLEEHRTAICELIQVIDRLKEPRPFTERPRNIKYRTKMTAILRTAEMTENFCGLVLGELLRAAESPQRLAGTGCERQLRVLKALYRVHSSYIARDGSLRFYIVLIQERLGVNPLLGQHHHQMAGQPLPPLQSSVEEIAEAVRRSGGIPPQVQKDTAQQQIESPSHVQPYGLRPHLQHQGGLIPGTRPSLAFPGSTAIKVQKIMTHPVVSPRSQASERLLGYQDPAAPASSLQSGGTLEALPPSSPLLRPGVHVSSQDFQGRPLELPHVRTLTVPPAVQSHQAVGGPRALLQRPLLNWLPREQPLQGAAPASYSARAPFMDFRGHNLQAPSPAFSGPKLASPEPSMLSGGQDIQPTPATLSWSASSEGKSASHDVLEGSEGTTAGFSANRSAKWQVSFTHGPAGVPHPVPRQSWGDAAGTLANVRWSYREYSLFGQGGQSLWPQSGLSQLLTGASGPMHGLKREGAIQQGTDEDRQRANIPIGGHQLTDSTYVGADPSADW